MGYDKETVEHLNKVARTLRKDVVISVGLDVPGHIRILRIVFHLIKI